MTINKQIEKLDDICPLFINNPSKRKIRHNFFSNIQTEIQAYLLGFHAADGSVNLKRNTLRVKVTKKDEEIIELFKSFISPDAYCRNVEGFTTIIREKQITTKNASEISIASKYITEDLIELGFGPKKTYLELHLPKLKKELLAHFIRGYFDGDGCITGEVRKPNPKNREKNYRVVLRFDICSKQKSILSDIQEFFIKNEINATITYIKRDDMYRLNVSAKESLKKVFNLLYTNSNFYLQRKYDKFNYYVNTEVSQIISDHCNA